jgi:YVTN family beta-propeller protein
VRVVAQDLGPGSGTVSTIDVTEKTKNPTDITVGSSPGGMALTRDGKTALVGNTHSDTVSTIDMNTRTNPDDITVGTNPGGVAVTPDGKTAFVTTFGSGTVSTIDVKTGTRHPTDITVGAGPVAVAVTPCRR